MKQAIILLTGTVVFLASCRKDGDGLQDAVITGYDMGMTPCSGGLMINIGDDTKPYGAGMMRTKKLPEAFNGNQPLKLPLRVRISWMRDTTMICGNWVIVTQAVIR
jgi:hypothetical protein